LKCKRNGSVVGTIDIYRGELSQITSAQPELKKVF
jgi:hypothetical protein